MSEHGQYRSGSTPPLRRPEDTSGRYRGVLAGARTSRQRAVAVVATAALGFGGAAAIDQFALAAPALAPAADAVPAGDGLTRLVVTGAAGSVSDAELAALQGHAGVATVQRVFDGSALVATHGLAPADLAGVVAGADVQFSATGTFSGGTVSDPYWARYGYNLANTGSNALNQPAVAGADVDAPTGWRAGTGTGMVLAVTDSGMDTSHPDLQGALWTNPDCDTDADGDGLVGDCHGWNFYGASADVVNGGGNSHGTGVAGIAGARAGNGEGSAGVAPGVQIMPLVVGYGSSVDITAAAAAIHYAVDHGADVVNASWGGPGLAPVLAAAIDYADAHGVLVVAAAGNDSLDRDRTPTYPANSTSPAVLTVGSSTAADTISSFSGYGATTVDLFAPGQAIVSPAPGGGYVAMDGTSMAAPEVAAAVALYRAHYPAATMTQLRQQLLDDTQPVAAFARRSVSGGRLSLTALGNTAAEVQYSFTSMVAAAGPVAPQVVVSGSTPPGGYAVRFGLGEEYSGELFAVSGQAITLDGVTATTDDSGEALFDLGPRPSAGPLVLSPSTELQAARYVLTVQLYRDGAPVGLRFAAPLLVGQRTVPTAPAPSGSASPTPRATTTPTATATSTPRTTTAAPGIPSVGAPTAPGTGPAAPTTGGPRPGTSAPGSAAPTAAVPTASQPTATKPTASVPPGSVPGSSTAAPTTTRAAGPTSAPTSGAATPTRAATPTAGVPTGSTPSVAGTSAPTSAGSTPGAGTAPTSPGPGGSTTYPPSGPFGLTSISPTRVGVEGGTRVTVTGSAIPANAQVRIGLTSPAVVSSVSATRLVFTTPALVAGTYDVYVSVPGGTPTVLTGGLTYLPAASAPTTPAAGTTPRSTPTASAPAATPTAAAPTAVAGPHGERLVRSSVFRSLAPAIWRVNCASACSGLAV
ncbi:S8 family serine peptidase [Modestobacter altitudinis]|uniref:S8 family serine peptidase n=1 Tax=Modestobacter altitudinis TaxID=2213158 RepID=UPI00110CF41F|nr:S8 family serine peptidase [Modestobacter altitudinis]